MDRCNRRATNIAMKKAFESYGFSILDVSIIGIIAEYDDRKIIFTTLVSIKSLQLDLCLVTGWFERLKICWALKRQHKILRIALGEEDFSLPSTPSSSEDEEY